MELFTIITLLLSGFILIVLEILILPGKAFFGTVGGLLMLAGIGITFAEYSAWAGMFTLIGSGVTVGATMAASYKYGWLDRFIEKGQLEGKAINKELLKFNVGEKGRSKSPLRPSGLAEFNGLEVHVESQGIFIAPNVDIEIVSIEENKIVVKTIGLT